MPQPGSGTQTPCRTVLKRRGEVLGPKATMVVRKMVKCGPMGTIITGTAGLEMIRVIGANRAATGLTPTTCQTRKRTRAATKSLIQTLAYFSIPRNRLPPLHTPIGRMLITYNRKRNLFAHTSTGSRSRYQHRKKQVLACILRVSLSIAKRDSNLVRQPWATHAPHTLHP